MPLYVVTALDRSAVKAPLFPKIRSSLQAHVQVPTIEARYGQCWKYVPGHAFPLPWINPLAFNPLTYFDLYFLRTDTYTNGYTGLNTIQADGTFGQSGYPPGYEASSIFAPMTIPGWYRGSTDPGLWSKATWETRTKANWPEVWNGSGYDTAVTEYSSKVDWENYIPDAFDAFMAYEFQAWVPGAGYQYGIDLKFKDAAAAFGTGPWGYLELTVPEDFSQYDGSDIFVNNLTPWGPGNPGGYTSPGYMHGGAVCGSESMGTMRTVFWRRGQCYSNYPMRLWLVRMKVSLGDYSSGGNFPSQGFSIELGGSVYVPPRTVYEVPLEYRGIPSSWGTISHGASTLPFLNDVTLAVPASISPKQWLEDWVQAAFSSPYPGVPSPAGVSGFDGSSFAASGQISLWLDSVAYELLVI